MKCHVYILNSFNKQTFYMYLMFWLSMTPTTVLPAKSESDVMFGLQSYQGLEIDRSLVFKSYPQDSINNLCINPIRRIGLIHM